MDRKELLVCVRYESRRGEPVEKAYENFCEIFGNEAMTYLDFDFWFYRFKDGKFDLDYDRSQDLPKSLLANMPMDVMEKIFGNLEWKERAICRKVSRDLRKQIDTMTSRSKGVSLFSSDGSMFLRFNDETLIRYEKTDNGCLVECVGNSKFFNGADFRQIMYADLKTLLINPNLQMDEFSVDMREYPDNEDISVCLSSLGHQLNVESCLLYARNQEDVLAILPYLKPRALEKVQLWYDLFSTEETPKLNIDRVVELDQWKQAKSLDSQMIILDFKIEHFLHFNDIRAHIDSISKEDAICLKNTILAAPDFESCHLEVESDESFENIHKIFGEGPLSIPGSTSYIDVDYHEQPNFISLEKRS